MTVIVRAELRVGLDNREEFVKLTMALADAAADEAGTLRYDWYRSEDPTMFVVLEEYADPDAAMVHNQNCAEFLHRIAELSEMKSVHLHGRLGPVLESWVDERTFAHAHPPLRA